MGAGGREFESHRPDHSSSNANQALNINLDMILDHEELAFSSERLLVSYVPDSSQWIPLLLEKLHKNLSSCKKSHKFNGRWENLYLDIDTVPEAKIPIKFARELALKIWDKNSLALFISNDETKNCLPPFWFNISKKDDLTGLHDHSQTAILSGVVYLKAAKDSGNLYFKKDNEIEIEPEIGKLVLFPSHLKHGVRANKSNVERISLAFNLQHFPLINRNL